MKAGRGAAPGLIACLLILALAMRPAHGQQGNFLTLYACASEEVAENQGKILTRDVSLCPPQKDDASAGLAFRLYPPLTSRLMVKGFIRFFIWMSADLRGRTSASIILSELDASRNRTVLIDASAPVDLERRVKEFLFMIYLEHIFEVGSMIEFGVKVANATMRPNLHWGGDFKTRSEMPIVGPGFFYLTVTVLDGSGKGLANAEAQVFNGPLLVTRGLTGKDGAVKFPLEPTGSGPGYTIKVKYLDSEVGGAQMVSLNSDRGITVYTKVYELTILAFNQFGGFLENGTVVISRNGKPLITGVLSRNGTFSTRVPEGNYSVTISHDLVSLTYSVSVKGTMLVTYTFPSLLHIYNLYIGLGVALAMTSARLALRRLKLRKLSSLIGKALLRPASVMIYGPPGSGKSVLLAQLVRASLREGRKLLFITSTSAPEEVRHLMVELGADKSLISESLKFIDAYTPLSDPLKGGEDGLRVSPTDITSLGIKLSKLLESYPDADVFMDSLAPMAYSLKAESVLNFAAAVGAKVKGYGGLFVFTLTSGIDEALVTKLEAMADCVIELSVKETKRGFRRAMKLKKMRGFHEDQWIPYSIKPKKGMLFK